MSKVALHSLCWLDGADAYGGTRLERNIRYVKYYQSIKEHLGFDDIHLCDNNSDDKNIVQLTKHFPGDGLEFHRNQPHLPRTSMLDYPYCWRGLYNIRKLIGRGYTKILMIDSDYFILSGRLAKFLKDLDTGWSALYCPKHGFPEAACQILCEDAFPLFMDYTSIPWEQHNGQLMEKALPFTKVHKYFIADRFGEDFTPQALGMDAYGQAATFTKLEFIPCPLTDQDTSPTT